MNPSSIPLVDVVLIGGGHAHVHVIKMMGMRPIEGLRVSLITKDVQSPYSGMIPGFVEGCYTKDECHIDLGKLCSFAGVSMLRAEVIRLDTQKRLIYCSDNRPPLSYDVLSINVGIIPRPLSSALDSASAHVTPVKPIDGFAARWEAIRRRVLVAPATPGGDGRAFTVAVVGGGAGGVELAFAINHRLKNDLASAAGEAGGRPSAVRVELLNRGPQLLAGHNNAVRGIVLRRLLEESVTVHLDADVCEVRAAAAADTDESLVGAVRLVTRDGRCFAADEVIWCTEGVAHPWLRESGLDCDEQGCVKVKPTLESVNMPGVFAAGDACCNVTYPRSKAGVFAVRAGPPLLANIRHAVLREPLEPWEPQSEFLGILGTGGGRAVASKGGLGAEGAYLWTLKETIDRRWMRGYQELPSMEQMAALAGTAAQTVTGADSRLSGAMGAEAIDMLSKAKMRCGGCGSKVGAQVLSRALQRVRSRLFTGRPEVVAGLGMHAGDDAALVVPPSPPAYLVHTIDYFRSFLSDPYVFGQIAANHALSDIHAMNAEPVSALALCVVPYGPEKKVEDYLVQLLAGALKVLSAERCALVGGHTSEGSEAALGLSVTGVVHPDRVFRKGPLRLGDALVLTKGLGTGAIMAADMRAKASGSWVSEATRSMLQSNGPAAGILQRFDCQACTDVTGFGFLGHLLEMLQFGEEEPGGEEAALGSEERLAVSVCGGGDDLAAVDLCLGDVPLLTGAADCVRLGIMSSLHPQNVRCARAVRNVEAGRGVDAYPLLFDPQTSGGLLATVPPERADELVEALRAAGYEAASVVGRVVPRARTPFPPLVSLV